MTNINILVAFDKKFAPVTGVMLTSLLRNNKDCIFDVYAFVDDSWNKREELKFKLLLHKYRSRLFVYRTNDKEVLKHFPLNPDSHITIPTYYRLFAADILPKTVSKILYLDGDILVNGNIKPLWETDLSGYAFAGALDCSFVRASNYERLGYGSEYGYYNAGVTLYNLEYWRKNILSKKLIEYIIKNKERLLWNDQDAVNGLLYRYRKNIPIRYNFQIFFLLKDYWVDYSNNMMAEIIQTFENPVIIHYIGDEKPWSSNFKDFPYFKYWIAYSEMSLWWRSFFPIKQFFRVLAKRILRITKPSEYLLTLKDFPRDLFIEIH